ncbi:MAG TPA: hybrid sensor histidine kinase/response regulator [Polyangiaceae bacterium]|nr:hybrid sensor histidine kinase/response regulator [Polyangiaceae bacterium]
MSKNDPAPLASVLVVDDTVENLRLLAGMLGAQGYEVRPVTSGRQALIAAEHDPPDLVLLDINMPEMNGYEVCRRFKQVPALRDVPVIFLTALGDVADKVRAFEVGGVDYVTKPFQIDEVTARVRTHVALRRATREISLGLERLQQLEKLRDDLVHMIVHDMRSPLMVLMAHLSLIESENRHTLSPTAAEDLRAASRAVRVLSGMADDLLDVSRLEEGKLPLDEADHDVTAIAGEVCAAHAVIATDRKVELTSAAPVPVRCDAALVRRVMENLVGNAVKHTPRGGGVHVSVEERGPRVRVEVADEGQGVPREARDRIFEKFETLRSRREHRYHSAGLGLAFCKLAVEAHGGSIGVDDGATGGSTFWFELPR